MNVHHSRQHAATGTGGRAAGPRSDPSVRSDEEAGGLHRARRDRLLEQLGDGIAVIPAARIRFRSRDTEYRFRQDPDFYYLTGFDEPDAVAVLTPHDEAHRFTLFVRPRDRDREVWDGVRAGVEGARERFGATAAYPIEELERRLQSLLEPADLIHYALGSHRELDTALIALLDRLRRARARSGRGPTGILDPGEPLGRMRVVKEKAEIERIRVAARIAAAGHRAAIARARPGAGEWELEAALEASFRSAGATGPSFPSIVAAGENATVLHYVRNDARIGDGDLVLIDAGAEWGMYCSDITRTFPASGRFSPEQRAVYELVLEAEQAAIGAVVPGAPFSAIHEAALDVLVPGMVGLGLLTGDIEQLRDEKEYRRFYMHQTSHWIGLDVHDVGAYVVDGEPVILEPGMVLTIEPGLYIPRDAEGVPDGFGGTGVRIEDNLVVTEAGHEVLTRDVPVDPDDLEAIVGCG
jgi:Xaa-Pro aminopeptidase